MENVNSKFPTIYQDEKKFKVIVIGSPGVGKTSLTYKYTNGVIIDPMVTCGVDICIKHLEIDGQKIALQIWDTAGLESNRQVMVKNYYRNCHAVVFVYDVTRVDTFNSLEMWKKECDENGADHAIKVLVGNKCDQPMAVPRATAQSFADKYNMPFFETCGNSLEDNVIDGVFTTVAMKLNSQKEFQLPATRQSFPSPAPQPKNDSCC